MRRRASDHGTMLSQPLNGIVQDEHQDVQIGCEQCKSSFEGTLFQRLQGRYMISDSRLQLAVKRHLSKILDQHAGEIVILAICPILASCKLMVASNIGKDVQYTL